MNKFPIEKEWLFGSPIWLDNQRLVFNLWKDLSEISSILPVVVVNPFTGEQQELVSDYPDLRPSGSGPGGSNFDFVYSTVVYHPSLNLVVYPQTTRNGFFVVLWDRKAQKALARVEDLGGFGHTPIWSPDGDQFVVAVVRHIGNLSADVIEAIEEWFSVSRDGEVQQLTRLGENFSSVVIGRARWSPDGHRLAFLLTTKPSACGEGEYLSVLEMKTRQVTNYCILGSLGRGSPAPIWSPDSRYVALESLLPDSNPLILVDIEQGWAAQIGNDKAPVGWLAVP